MISDNIGNEVEAKSNKTEKVKKEGKNRTKKVKLKTIGKPKIEIFEEETDSVVFWDVVNKYYMLKSKYEKDFMKLKKGATTKVVPACVNCKRHVGTKFAKIIQSEVNYTRGRIFSIKCGDTLAPCSLNVHFMIPNITNFNKIFDNDYKGIEKFKRDIIGFKNDLIFDYQDEGTIMHFFEEAKEKLNNLLNNNQYSLDLFSSIQPEKEKIEELKTEERKFMDEYKTLSREYRTTGSKDILRESIHAYMQIKPISTQIREMSYIQNSVEEEDGEYKLIQKELPISYIETIDRVPVLSEKLKPFIFTSEIEKPEATSGPKKIFKKIVIVPATEAIE